MTELLDNPLVWGIGIPLLLVWGFIVNWMLDNYTFPYEYRLPVKALILSTPAWLALIYMGLR